jgi:hypothetical protein
LLGGDTPLVLSIGQNPKQIVVRTFVLHISGARSVQKEPEGFGIAPRHLDKRTEDGIISMAACVLEEYG